MDNTTMDKLPAAIEFAKRFTFNFTIAALQRHLLIGYAPAAKLTEQMEKMGIVSSVNPETFKRTVNHEAIAAYEAEKPAVMSMSERIERIAAERPDAIAFIRCNSKNEFEKVGEITADEAKEAFRLIRLGIWADREIKALKAVGYCGHEPPEPCQKLFAYHEFLEITKEGRCNGR